MKNGTMLVKMGGREETYWVCSLFACGVIYYFLSKVILNDTAGIVAFGLMIAAVAARYTVLNAWFARKIEWTLDDETLTFDGQAYPVRAIRDVSFKRNRLSNGAWYLTIDMGTKIRVESLNNLRQNKASLESMTALADALLIQMRRVRR